MNLSLKKINFFVVLFFGLLFLALQLVMQHRSNAKMKKDVETTRFHHKRHDSDIASECLENLRDPSARAFFRHVVSKSPDPETILSVLVEYFPGCAKRPPRRFIAHFVQLLSNILDDIEKNKFEFESPWPNRTHLQNKMIDNLCPELSPHLQGKINTTFNDTGEISVNGVVWNWPPSLEEVALEYHKQVSFGGFYKPEACHCRGYSAIIIPFRDREPHLRFFLHYTHNLLWRQQLCYVIIVVEQDDDRTFNKGQLMNTGFYYASSLNEDIDCFVFHDVDIIAEDDRIIYTCRDGTTVNHISPYIDKYKYELCCGVTVGAAVGFTKQQFEQLNGFSNEYAGWGGEDDDMDERIRFKNFDIWRSQQNYTRFKMIRHDKDKRNPDNDDRMLLLQNATDRQPYDGLNSLQTTITSVVRFPTHTRIKVATSEADSRILPET